MIFQDSKNSKFRLSLIANANSKSPKLSKAVWLWLLLCVCFIRFFLIPRVPIQNVIELRNIRTSIWITWLTTSKLKNVVDKSWHPKKKHRLITTYASSRLIHENVYEHLHGFVFAKCVKCLSVFQNPCLFWVSNFSGNVLTNGNIESVNWFWNLNAAHLVETHALNIWKLMLGGITSPQATFDSKLQTPTLKTIINISTHLCFWI